MAGLGMLAAISPQWAQRMKSLGGDETLRELNGKDTLPSDDEDAVLKNLAGQIIQPYRPGWAALPGVGASMVGGMAAAKLRENKAIRQRADNTAWDGYIGAIMPKPVGGMAAGPAVAAAPTPAPAPPPTPPAPVPAQRPEASYPGVTPVPEKMAPLGMLMSPTQPQQAPPLTNQQRYRQTQVGGGQPGSPLPANDVAELSGMLNLNSNPRLEPAVTPAPANMAPLGMLAGGSSPPASLPSPDPARGMVGAPASPPAATPTGDPRMARYERELTALGPMLKNPGTRAFAIQRLGQLEAARAKAEDQTFDLGEGHTRFQMVRQPDGTMKAVPVAMGGQKVDSTSRKAIYEAQDELPNLAAAVDQLKEARGLLGTDAAPGIYTGMGAQTRSDWNQSAPSVLPNLFTDPKRAKATQRYNQIMGAEAISAMSQTLKGASTDYEMKEFVRIMNDPNQKPSTKMKALDTMLRRAEAHRQNKFDRIRELGGRIPDLGGGAPTRGGADPLGIR